MHKKQHTGLQEFFGPNSGTWMLIFVHLAILVAVVVVFSEIIEKLGNF
jgi:hypothetical protein